MTIWVDAQISPRIARWISTNVSVAAIPVRDLNLRDAEDEVIYSAAQTANVIVLTKDSDFVQLQERRGPPPKIIWLTCGTPPTHCWKVFLSGTWRGRSIC